MKIKLHEHVDTHIHRQSKRVHTYLPADAISSTFYTRVRCLTIIATINHMIKMDCLADSSTSQLAEKWLPPCMIQSP